MEGTADVHGLSVPITINPKMVPRWRLRNPNRRRSLQNEQLAWTGTEEQRERTTTDAAEFAAHPERFTWFHDRARGQVFVRDTRSDLERSRAGEDASKPAPILPHRYLKHVPKVDSAPVTTKRRGLHLFRGFTRKGEK